MTTAMSALLEDALVQRPTAHTLVSAPAAASSARTNSGLLGFMQQQLLQQRQEDVIGDPNQLSRAAYGSNKALPPGLRTFQISVAVIVFVVSMGSAIFRVRYAARWCKQSFIDLANVCASGMFLGMSFNHLLPEAMELAPEMKNPKLNIVGIGAFFGYMLILFCERVLGSAASSSSDESQALRQRMSAKSVLCDCDYEEVLGPQVPGTTTTSAAQTTSTSTSAPRRTSTTSRSGDRQPHTTTCAGSSNDAPLLEQHDPRRVSVTSCGEASPESANKDLCTDPACTVQVQVEVVCDDPGCPENKKKCASPPSPKAAGKSSRSPCGSNEREQMNPACTDPSCVVDAEDSSRSGGKTSSASSTSGTASTATSAAGVKTAAREHQEQQQVQAAQQSQSNEHPQLGLADEGINSDSHDHEHFDEGLLKKGGKGAYIMMLALSVHSVFEGIVIGIAPDFQNAAMVSFCVLAHKWAAAFAIGTAFATANVPERKIYGYVSIFAVSTPVGIVLGILISSIQGGAFLGCTNAIAAGTLLYIAMSEIIPEEFVRDPKLLRTPHPVRKFFSLALGYAFIVAVQMLDTD